MPSYEHEEINRLINDLLVVVAMEWHIDYCNAGSTTFRREDLERGFEPDSCFYIQHARQIAGKKHLDLAIDPPPDVVVAVDITHSSLDKLALFAVLGVPEVWCYDRHNLRILTLQGEVYEEGEQSLALPRLRREALHELMDASQHMPRTAWLHHMRTWAQEQQG